ncbi:MAG: hypothetical protein N2C14_30780, partial [Planctomycetales bacterium]
ESTTSAADARFRNFPPPLNRARKRMTETGARRRLEETDNDDPPLGLSEPWFRLGLVDETILAELRAEWAKGEDRNPERYRYGLFQRFLADRRPLSADLADALYDLGAADPDPSMGGVMMGDVIRLTECPRELRERASDSGKPWLKKLVYRLQLLQELEGELTAELFERSVSSMDPVVHRRLMERQDLSSRQLELLTEYGGNRALRSLAKTRLESSQDST